MQNKKKTEQGAVPAKTFDEASGKRFLTIFVCVFLALLVVFGSVFGIIIAVQSSRTAVRYGSASISRGALAFLAPYYKQRYIRLLGSTGISVHDTEEFWQSEAEDGKSYGELFSESYEEYIRSLVASASLYDLSLSYGRTERKAVRESVDAIVDSIADGKKSEFNSMCAKYGFDYNDMLDAAMFIYKSSKARIALYGSDGSGIANIPEDCQTYLETYSHVDLMFIRLEDVLVKDDAGNIEYDSNRNPLTRDLTEEEKAARLADVQRLRGLIAGTLGSGDVISVDAFEHYLNKYASDGDKDMLNTGYYFHKSAEMTAEFATVFADVVEASLDMEIGEYREVKCDEIKGVCFIYKYNVASGAYANGDNVFFSDFYSDAANYLYPLQLSELSAEVELLDKFYEVDILEIPSLSSALIPNIK